MNRQISVIAGESLVKVGRFISAAPWIAAHLVPLKTME
jgi:hypothetical protein